MGAGQRLGTKGEKEDTQRTELFLGWKDRGRVKAERGQLRVKRKGERSALRLLLK